MDINGKVAVVTGGASGLGRASAERLSSLGAKVAIFDVNDELGNAVADQLGDTTAYFNVDVTDEDSIAAALAATMEAFGAIHVCCNYAGIGTPGRTLNRQGPLPILQFQRVIDVNLVGTFNVLRLAAAEMSKHDPVTDDGSRGVIINTSSIAAYEGQIGQAAYSASKGGIVGMTLPVARDLATVGIRCCTIVPGLIDTPMMAGFPEEVRASLGASVLFPQRLGLPEEIAHTAQYIIENDYVNGECIRMDGGIRMQPK